MKITLDLPDDLLIEVRDIAARRGTTLREMVTHALRREIQLPKGRPDELNEGSQDGLPAEKSQHSNDPLHGVTLETILRTMVDRYGWAELADRIPVRCFMFDPTTKSSLTFLRKTPWARKRLEDWYVYLAVRERGFSDSSQSS
jgi:hypothetical protein